MTTAETSKLANTLYQVKSVTFGDEMFCFFAENGADAESKLRGWVRYHSHDLKDYTIREVREPKYKNNIHNEWVN